MKKNRYSEKGVGGAEAAAGGGMNASLLEGAMDEALEMEREATVRRLIEVREEYMYVRSNQVAFERVAQQAKGKCGG